MLLTKEVQVRVNAYTIGYYKSLGYEIPMRKASPSTFKKNKKEFVYDLNQLMTVKIEDLQKQSNILVEVLCDYCQQEIFSLPYYNYNNETKYVNKIACSKCKGKKYSDCTMLKYGVNNVSQLDWVQEKVKESNLAKYNVENYASTRECKEKMANTMMLRYGVSHVSQLPDFKDKHDKTCKERYGDSYLQLFTERASKTFRDRTGYNFPTQSPEVREKISRSLYENSSQMCSKQQLYIFNLYQSANLNIQLNYPISRFNADICIVNEKMDIEVDCGGHDFSVKIGSLTQEEFDRKEIIRSSIIKKEGYKIMRIVSRKDILPSDQILLQMLQESRNYFATTSHSWQIYDIDKSMLFNAENKQGIPYSFGELRKIK